MTAASVAARTCLLCLLAHGVAAAQVPPDLKALTIEELMGVDVTLASRRPEPVRSAAAAVSVITRDDIRRSGATTIADVLWLASGVHVARLNNGIWGVSTRGFNVPAANKLLVMIDGRTVYSPLFTGVFWNLVDYYLDDVERIEVIRGPGATLWGANAVNGVVNIVTRSSAETRGTSLVVGAGAGETLLAGGRVGGTLGPGTARVYTKYDRRGPGRLSEGGSADDRRDRVAAGFRFDAERGTDAWMITADAVLSDQRFSDLADGDFSGASIQARWTRTLERNAHLTLQAYYRRESRDVRDQLEFDLDTVDAELQYDRRFSGGHLLVAGTGGRVNRDDTRGGTVSFDPPSRTYSLWNGFVQHEHVLVPRRLFVTGGLKVERNAFSGAEWQPTARARFHPAANHTVWAAVSRPVRRPTRLDTGLVNRLPSGLVTAVGSRDFEAERLLALDAGYRVQPGPRVSFEAVAFHYTYDRLRSLELLNPPAPIPVVLANNLEGTSRGVEFTAALEPAPGWLTQASYTHQRISLTLDPSGRDASRTSSEANDPRHRFVLRQSATAGRLEVDVIVRRIGELPFPRVPAYTEMDARVAWWLRPTLELSVAGRDLLHPHHPEFGPAASQLRRAEPERSIRAQLTVRF